MIFLTSCTRPSPTSSEGDFWEITYVHEHEKQLTISYIGNDTPPEEITFEIVYGSNTTNGKMELIDNTLNLDYEIDDNIDDDINIIIEWDRNTESFTLDKEEITN
ncbi:hypothetical protein GCM10011346_40380 [Oceanobacillus neutriphilus]|uniref:Uncharacterized protein n=2 Tax=Oceanobacillus neutriphilus TaxID=531815 RepID=A0ABQ2NZZ9_9BACI|nr:hypothetical protein GCM10011346_40380 [Oceanobacillus neutriphilus]